MDIRFDTEICQQKLLVGGCWQFKLSDESLNTNIDVLVTIVLSATCFPEHPQILVKLMS